MAIFISEYFDYKGTKNNVSVNKLRHIIITTSVSGIRYRSAGCAVVARWLGGWHSVPERATYGTEEIFGAKNSLIWYATHLQTTQNSTCHIERVSKGAQNSRLHRLWTASWGTRCVFRGPRCMKTPSAPDAFSEACRAQSSTCRTGRIFSARNDPRSLCSLRPLPPFPSSR